MKHSPPPSDKTVVLDCETGRRLGCATFCCRLIVRLAPDEVEPPPPGGVAKRCVDKDPDTGLCVHLDPGTQRCRIWDRRPRVCREYDCNADPMLAVVLREGFLSLTHLVRRADGVIRSGGGPPAPVVVPRPHGN